MLKVTYVSAFNDNYIWILSDLDKHCVVIDPGQAKPVIDYIEAQQLTLDAILLTHNHIDHIGGMVALKEAYPSCRVHAHAFDQIAGTTHPLQGNDQFRVLGESFRVLNTPGHTENHVCFLGDGKLFCGDVLFSGGCGRVADNNYQEMFNSLNLLKSLPIETEVYCGHEYTSANLAFALAVDPTNDHLQAFRDHINRLRGQGQPTIPSTIQQEKLINPFLRINEHSIVNAISMRTDITDQLSIFTALRQWKDEF